MGYSAFFLFKRNESAPANKLLIVLEHFCMEQKLIFESYDAENNTNFDRNQPTRHTLITISDGPFADNSKQLAFDIHDENLDKGPFYGILLVDFEWSDSSQVYFRAVNSSYSIYGREDLLLEVAYGLLKAYPDACLWTEQEWLYTLTDIERIKNLPFNESWCYTNPKNW